MVDVATLGRAWIAAGRPEPDWQGRVRTKTVTPPAARDGVCALTGARGDVFDGRHVISDLFTAWDRFGWRHADPAGLAFSACAAWSLRYRPGMLRPHALIGGQWLAELDGPGLRGALEGLAADPAGAVTVPVSQQMHVLPWMSAGHIRTDHRDLTWSHSDLERLGTCGALKALGFSEGALTEPAPRWATLSRLNRADQSWALMRWDELDQWRAEPALLEIGLRATRLPKGA